MPNEVSTAMTASWVGKPEHRGYFERARPISDRRERREEALSCAGGSESAGGSTAGGSLKSGVGCHAANQHKATNAP